jgi:hypothetical protein
MIWDLQANPAECINAIKQLNEKPDETDLKGLDTIGRVKTRIVIDAEQSLTERAFRVNKVTKKTMGWSETDQRERRDALKKKGRKKEHIYWGFKRERPGEEMSAPINLNESKEMLEVDREEMFKKRNQSNSPNRKGDKKLPDHMFAKPYIPNEEQNQSKVHPYYNSWYQSKNIQMNYNGNANNDGLNKVDEKSSNQKKIDPQVPVYTPSQMQNIWDKQSENDQEKVNHQKLQSSDNKQIESSFRQNGQEQYAQRVDGISNGRGYEQMGFQNYQNTSINTNNNMYGGAQYDQNYNWSTQIQPDPVVYPQNQMYSYYPAAKDNQYGYRLGGNYSVPYDYYYGHYRGYNMAEGIYPSNHQIMPNGSGNGYFYYPTNQYRQSMYQMDMRKSEQLNKNTPSTWSFEGVTPIKQMPNFWTSNPNYYYPNTPQYGPSSNGQLGNRSNVNGGIKEMNASPHQFPNK